MKYTFLFILLLIACRETPQNESSDISIASTDSPYCHPDTLLKWKLWAEDSDEGLWEGDQNHLITMSLVQSYSGEDDPNPPFFSMNDVAVSGDSIFIADRIGCRIVCIGIEGTVIWEAGAQGEGPGHYISLFNIAVSDNYVLAADATLDKVDIYSRSGQLLESVSIINPTDIVFVDDSSFAVLSRLEPGGDVHLYRCSGEKLLSFGEGAWFEYPDHLIMREHNAFNSVMGPDSVLIVSRWETHRIFLYDIKTLNVSGNIARVFPTDVIEPEFHSDTNEIGGLSYVNMGRLFIGPEGMLNVGFAGFTSSGHITTSRDDIRAQVRIVDRYDWDWNYLDSYCIPINRSVVAFSREHGLFVNDFETGRLLRFTIQIGD